jgi:nucleoside-diphosphate-sugar epimerase
MNFFKNKKIVVTGGAGYLAFNIVKLLKDVDCRIVRLGRNGSNFPLISGAAQIHDVHVDVRDESIWDEMLTGVDVIFHLASQTSVYVANQEPSADLNVNVRPMLAMLEACCRNKFHPTIIFAGTSTEVGLPKELPVNEEPKNDPVTIYDLHKLMAESYLLHYAREGVVSGATLRLANVYGPGPRSSSADRGILNMMIGRALKGNDLTIYGDGNFMRDYVYVQDVATAFLKAAEHIDQTNSKYFVIGSGVGHTIANAIGLVAKRVELKTDKHANIIHVDAPLNLSPIEARNFVANSHSFMAATAWKAAVSLMEGVDLTIDYYIENS